ncbi:hypothetical protein [Patulibacter defluvii]|uniref:hypothetical protein n=1 Tax=Patulibacter defluvii TaxID=3095358 RepID=UPI002A757FB9|nr:hypothetical protein [Patulibacter sp. DM4]
MGQAPTRGEGRREPPLWVARLRWRLRGSSARIGFVVAVVADAVLLTVLPLSGQGGPLLGAVVLGGFLNLALVIAGGAIGSRLLRRRDPSLPRPIARDRAATYAMLLGVVLIAAAGVRHRPALLAERAQTQRIVQAAQTLASREGPTSIEREQVDVRQWTENLYRACMPNGQPGRAWCAFVRTDGGDPVARADPDARPNAQVAGVPGSRPVSLR